MAFTPLMRAATPVSTSDASHAVPLLAELWAGYWVAPWALAIKGLPVFIIGLALIALVILVMARALFRRAFWLIGHVVVPTIGLVAGLIALGNDLHGR